jgi:large subunit ribosomal protein L17
MRKRIFGKKLKRTTNQRKALFRSLSQALVLHGRIKTTEAKAKATRGEVEKLITHAKNNPETARQYLQRHVFPASVERIIAIAPVFKDRPGGYTRIIRLGGRTKDNASMVILEFVEKLPEIVKEKKASKKEVNKDAKANKTNKK